MRATKQKRKRSRFVIALLLPALVFVWLVGWSMYWLGHQRKDKEKNKTTHKEDNIKLVPAVALEEPSEIETCETV